MGLLSLQHPPDVSCTCRFRQYHCCCLHQQSGGNKILKDFVLTGKHSQHLHPCQIHSRQDECDWQQILEGRSDPTLKVVTSPGHCQPHLPAMGSSQPRSLCHKVQHQVSNLCVSSTGQQSPQHRCSSDELGRVVHIRIPKVQTDEVLHPHPCSPVLAKTVRIPGLPKTSPGKTKPPYLPGKRC